MEYENVKKPKEFLLELIKNNEKAYAGIELSLAIESREGKNILYRGRVDFIHHTETLKNEVTYDYGIAILAKRNLTLSEFYKFIDSLDSKIVDIKDLKQIEIGDSFDNTVYSIPSKYHYREIVPDWAVKDFLFQGNRNTSIQILNSSLVKPNCPTYPTFSEATSSFLKLTSQYFNNQPHGLQILVPDYSARLKKLILSEKNITVEIEVRESELKELLLKLYAKKENEEFVPNDFEIKSNNIEINLPFSPDELSLYLVNKNSEKVIDYVQFGGYHTDRYEGIEIKTPIDVIENLISQGENSHVEFKREFSKDEFLETVVAFANSGKGRIIIGVDNRSNIVGIFDDFSRLEQRIRGTISGNCEPKIVPEIEEVDYNGKPLMIVTIKEGTDKPYLVRNKSPYVRVHEDDIPMSRVELDKIYAERKQR